MVSYPAAWFTVEDVPEYTCVLYGPQPVTVDPTTRQTNAKVVVVASATTTYADTVAALTNRANWSAVTAEQVVVATLPAAKVAGTSTGTGAVPAGVTQYSYVVDRGSAGVVIIETAAKKGASDFETDQGGCRPDDFEDPGQRPPVRVGGLPRTRCPGGPEQAGAGQARPRAARTSGGTSV